jgi:hypothetical protein
MVRFNFTGKTRDSSMYPVNTLKFLTVRLGPTAADDWHSPL